MKQKTQFYTIISESVDLAFKKYKTIKEAKQEAMRLSVLNPGIDFTILSSVGVFTGCVKLKSFFYDKKQMKVK